MELLIVFLVLGIFLLNRVRKSGSSALDSKEEKRRCPSCDELVRIRAVKCRYCGEKLEPVRRYVGDGRLEEKQLEISRKNKY